MLHGVILHGMARGDTDKYRKFVVNEDDRNSFTSKQHTSRDMVRFTRVKVT